MEQNNKLKLKNKNTNKKLDIIHIILIIVSVGFLSTGIFNTNIWFDEAYSYGLINHGFADLIKIASSDVHPVLYYIILKIFVIIFGNSMIVFRITSLVPLVLLMIFSIVKIRKEFGSKISLIFTFGIGFLPIMIRYASEIRMYSWAMLFISLTAFYAYKAMREHYKNKYFILFAIFSVLAAYTHYYALFTICAINIYMLVLIIRGIKKEKLNEEQNQELNKELNKESKKISFKEYINNKLFKKWVMFGILHLVLYIPGIIIFLKQSLQVAGGFWITVKYPDILFDIIESTFKGEITNLLPLIFGTVFLIYIILKIIMLKKNANSTSLDENSKLKSLKTYRLIMHAIIPYVSVIIFALVVSLIRPVFITRYMIPMLPLLIFALSVILNEEKKKIIIAIYIACILAFCGINQVQLYNKNYNIENENLKIEMKELVKEDDIFVYSEIGAGSVMGVYFKDNQGYFYNRYGWGVEEAYKAFLPQIKTVRTLDDISEINNKNSRIWILDTENSNLRNELLIEEKENTIFEKEIYNPYSNTNYIFTLYE